MPELLIENAKTVTAGAPHHEVAKTVGRNTFFGILSNLVQIGSRLVMVPIVIAHIGLGGYGIWAVVMATAGYMRFGTAGIKSAFQKYVAEATGTGDYETASKLLSTGNFLMLGISLIVLIPMGLFSRELARAGGVPPEFLTAAAHSIRLLAAIMVMANWGAAYDAIVMGGHRIDLVRTFNMITLTAEAISIITLLHYGYGLFGMACVMAGSELVNLACCFFASRRVLPQIHVIPRYFTREMFRELLRFAFSYQLVGILEVLYGMILPVTMLKFFGTEIAGVYAVAIRLSSAAQMGLDALMQPLLSSGTMIFASGSVAKMTQFVKKSFKLTTALSLAPLGFVAAFGVMLVNVWTGQGDMEFWSALIWTCIAALFAGISRVQLILYRAAGNALHDNLRQGFRLAALVATGAAAPYIGFHGVLIALAAAEGIGVIYMFFALSVSLRWFHLKDLTGDWVRGFCAVALVIAAGYAAGLVAIPGGFSEREMLLMKLCLVSVGCLVALWPAAAITKVVSPDERNALMKLLPWKMAGAAGGRASQ